MICVVWELIVLNSVILVLVIYICLCFVSCLNNVVLCVGLRWVVILLSSSVGG